MVEFLKFNQILLKSYSGINLKRTHILRGVRFLSVNKSCLFHRIIIEYCLKDIITVKTIDEETIREENYVN
jgi:hypothetical protein